MQSFFSDFQAGLRSSSSTGCILTATTTRIARTLNIALYIVFQKVWHNIHKNKSWGISGQLFNLIYSVMNSIVWFWMGSVQKSVLLMLFLLKAQFLVILLSGYTLIIFLMMPTVILLSILIILVSKCDQTWDLVATEQIWLWNLKTM